MEDKLLVRKLENVEREVHELVQQLKSGKQNSREQLNRFNELVSKSKLSREDALKLAKQVNSSLHNRYKRLYPELT